MKPWKLAAIAALAFALRAWHLGSRSLWLDEGVSIGLARMRWHDFFQTLAAREANMSLYYLFLRGWAAIGERLSDSEIFLRLPSVIFGTAAIVVFVIFVQRILGPKVALLTGLLLSVSVLQIRYTREVRSYGLLLLLLAISWLLYEKAVRRGTRMDYFWWAIVSALAIYAHLFAALIILAQVVCLVFASLSRERIIRFAAASVAIFALILPLVFFVVYTKATPLSWVPPLGLSTLHLFATEFSNGGPVQIALATICLLACIVMFARSRDPERLPMAIVVIGTLLPIVVVAAVSLHQPAFLPRYLIVALPGFLLAVATPIAKLPRTFVPLVIAAILLLGVPLLRDFYREPAWNDFRSATNYIAEHAQWNDVLIIWEPMARPAVEFYAPRDSDHPFPAIVFPGDSPQLTAADFDARPEVAYIDRISVANPRVWILFDSSAEAADYNVWYAFFARRMALHHRLASRFKTNGFPGTQVLEFVRP